MAVRQTYQINDTTDQFSLMAYANGKLRIQNNISGQDCKVDLITKDSDLTDAVKYRTFALGDKLNPNNSRIVLGWDPASNQYELETKQDGAALLYPLVLGMEGDPSIRFNVDKTMSLLKELIANQSFVSFGSALDVTIAGGVITATQSYHKINPENLDPTDDLDTINGASNGRLLILRSVNSAKDVVVKDGTGNIQLEGSLDFTLGNVKDRLILLGGSNDWKELSRSNNA